MGKRREARERAVQFLFQHDLNPPDKLDEALEQFWVSQRAAAIAEEKAAATWGEPTELPPPTAEEAEVRLFADPLIRGTIEHRDEADALIRKHAKNWELHRIAAVDRNILRCAVAEFLGFPDTPRAVVINEALELKGAQVLFGRRNTLFDPRDRPLAEITPTVTDPSNPKGAPTAMAQSATLILSELPSSAT